jgi:hypothetical protein
LELETDERGMVTFLPLVTWGVTTARGSTVGLAVDYYANAQDAAAKRTTRLQIHIDPATAVEFAKAMQGLGEAALRSLPAATIGVTTAKA